MPAMSTVFKWLREKEKFSEQYAIAKEECADALVEDMLDIADNQIGNVVNIDGKEVFAVDGPAVAHGRLRVDTRKWAASKLKPKKYGEKIQADITSGGKAIKNEWHIHPTSAKQNGED